MLNEFLLFQWTKLMQNGTRFMAISLCIASWKWKTIVKSFSQRFPKFSIVIGFEKSNLYNFVDWRISSNTPYILLVELEDDSKISGSWVHLLCDCGIGRLIGDWKMGDVSTGLLWVWQYYYYHIEAVPNYQLFFNLALNHLPTALINMCNFLY